MEKLTKKQGAFIAEIMKRLISEYADYTKKVLAVAPHFKKQAQQEILDLEETKTKILSMIETEEKMASEKDLIQLASIAHYPDHMEPDEYWYANCAVRELQRKAFVLGYEEGKKAEIPLVVAIEEKPCCNVCGKEDEELFECERCNELYCDSCQASYNQFTQIDYNCCKPCSERDRD